MDVDEGWKAKQKVREKYPHAITIRGYPGYVVIEKLVPEGQEHFLGGGQTFDEAWIDAARKLR